MYYVTMTDKFFSGWGKAEGKINKFVICCATYDEAETVERNAHKRKEMKYINITSRRPSYSSSRYVTSWENYDNLGSIWKE